MDPKFHGIQWTSQGSIDQFETSTELVRVRYKSGPVSNQFEASLSQRPGRDQSQISLRPVRDQLNASPRSVN